ncbi:MAG: hypothetical protein KatS3mg038_3624 [Candidatus Kapaibacterium sp.]|nr:MAG: hypothetical protein KatS3mg038_3624 [Candidatus Kapabacteria bacterium]
MEKQRKQREPRYKMEEVLQAVQGCGGFVSAVAQRLGCNWTTARRYIERWPETQEAFGDEKERTLDVAEMTIVRAIEQGDIGAAKWYLSRMGRHRGWGDTEPQAQGDVDIIIRWADDPDADEP